MKLIVFCLSFIILSSCSHHYLVKTRGCKSFKGDWYIEEGRARDFRFREHIWGRGFSSEQRVWLVEMIKKKGLRCEDIEGLHVTFEKDFGDVFISLIPGLSRRTLVIEGIGKVPLEKN